MPTRFTSLPSNPCNAISKCSSFGTRILISLTWRTRCIRKRSMSMHSLCSILFFCWHVQSVHIFQLQRTLQQTLIQIGRDRNFVDKSDPFDLFSVNSAIVGETLYQENVYLANVNLTERIFLCQFCRHLSSASTLSSLSMTIAMISAILSISSSFMPRVVTAGVPSLTPLVTNGERGSLGIVFLLQVM